MPLFLSLVFGLFIGRAAPILAPGADLVSPQESMGVGVLGAFFGASVGRLSEIHRGGDAGGFMMSLLGSILFVVGYHALARRRIAI
jgi:uncharacterized membrane protein YeaQ/YmgE (transglycosylase-associated protein family)